MIALIGSSIVYALFGSLQYTILALVFFWIDLSNPGQMLIFMGMAQIVGTIGVILRSPVLIFMKPIREALKRAVLSFKKWSAQLT